MEIEMDWRMDRRSARVAGAAASVLVCHRGHPGEYRTHCRSNIGMQREVDQCSHCVAWRWTVLVRARLVPPLAGHDER